MLHVLVHTPSFNLQNCELTYLESEKIDMQKALSQHQAYIKMIQECGVEVDVIKDNLDLADSVFVEDPIIVFDEVAVVTSMGVESRRSESEALENYFSKIKPIRQIKLPAKIEGGDVLVIGKKVYVGLSPRTNQEAIDALAAILKPYEYEVIGVKVHGCLHLKTCCTALDNQTLLINKEWVDTKDFQGYAIIETPKEEPFGANIMQINGYICMNKAFPKTLALIEKLEYKVKSCDISEFVKAEAGLTCMSVRYNK